MTGRIGKMLAAAIVALGFVFGAGAASAASVCKGMSNSKCEGATACYWVKGYKTKAGSNVKAHCRAKPGGGAAAAKKKPSAKKAAATSSSSSSKKATSSTSKKTSSKKSSTAKKKKTTTKKKTDKKKKKPTS